MPTGVVDSDIQPIRVTGFASIQQSYDISIYERPYLRAVDLMNTFESGHLGQPSFQISVKHWYRGNDHS